MADEVKTISLYSLQEQLDKLEEMMQIVQSRLDETDKAIRGISKSTVVSEDKILYIIDFLNQKFPGELP